MSGTALNFGTSITPFGPQQGPWSLSPYGTQALGINSFVPPYGQLGINASSPVAGTPYGAQPLQQLLQILQVLPQQLQHLQQLGYLQQQQLQHLQQLAQIIPAQLLQLQQLIQFVPQQIQQMQQPFGPLATSGVPLTAPWASPSFLGAQSGHVM